MKKLLLSLVALLTCAASWAALGDDGYYRVNNYMSKRYIYVYDNKGYLDYSTTSADMAAIELWLGHDRTISDPASVMYVENQPSKGSNFYDFRAQGTGVFQIISVYPQIWESPRNSSRYLIGATHAGITKYLCDSEHSLTKERGRLNDNGKDEWRKWEFTPIDAASDNYFGLAPEIRKGSDYYTTLYASFPFSFYSSGMKAYVVDKCDNGMAVVKEVSGVIPASTPVIVKCSSAEATSNRLSLGGTPGEAPSNLLCGIYFNNTSLSHNNQTPNDKATMRVLGLMSDGELGFVVSDDQYLAANRAYLTVPEGSPAEIRIVSQEEYEASFVTVTVASASAEQGSVWIDSEGTVSKKVAKGTQVRLQASAKAPYLFSSWTLGGTQVSTSATYEITATENAAYTADFVISRYPVSLTSSNGSVTVTAAGTPLAAGQSYDHGTAITVSGAAPDFNYTFGSLKVNGTDVSDAFAASGSYTFSLTGATEIVADFTRIPGPQLSLAVTGQGNIVTSTTDGDPLTLDNLFVHGQVMPLEAGTVVYFYLLPAETLYVTDFSINGVPATEFIAGHLVWEVPTVNGGMKVAYTLGTDDVSLAVNFSADNAVDTVGTDNLSPSEYFDLRGIRVDSSSLRPGIYLKRTGSVVEKVVVR